VCGFKLFFYGFIFGLNVTPRCISLDEDVFERLDRLRLDGESYSDTIRRLLGVGRVSDLAGLWVDMSDEEFNRVLEAVREARKCFEESFQSRRVDYG
jgi:predicted CopG family antitoxin